MGSRKDKIMDTVDKIDNKVDLTYVAERLMRITEISDRRKMETAIEEFKEECLRNIGVNVVNEYGGVDD
jgi:hypothetical protein